MMLGEGVACMVGWSLGARFGLAANLLLVTGLALGLKFPDNRPPGVDEKVGVPTELYCPSDDPPFGPDGPPCGKKLRRRQQDAEDKLFCSRHGLIDVNKARVSPPSRS